MPDAILPDEPRSRDADGSPIQSKVPTLKRVMDDLPEGVAIIDASTGDVTQNTVANEIFSDVDADRGLPTDAGSGQDASTAFQVDGSASQQVESSLRRALEGEVLQSEQLAVLNPSTGQDAVLLANSAPLHDGSGAIEGAVTVFRDITPLKEHERRREERLNEATHDLKNLLAGIHGMSQVVQSRLQRDDPSGHAFAVEGLQTIVSTVRRLTLQVNVLMDIAHERTGKPDELHRTSVNLVDLMARSVSECQLTTDLHVIHLDASDGEPVGLFDEARLRAVLDNLLGNAVKYSPQGGDIRVTVQAARRANKMRVLIRIADPGIGIPSAALPRVFERYYRASNTEGVIPGTGLGLTSVRRIVRQHGGSVKIESVEGSGTTVTIRLPLIHAPRA